MDERETIPRREAVLGIGLLSALTLGFMGLVAYRIIQAKPHRGPQSAAPSVWASQAPSVTPTNLEVTEAASANPPEPQLANDALPPAAPIPTIDDGAASVPAASESASEVAPPAGMSAVEPPSVAPEAARPRFVAPGGR